MHAPALQCWYVPAVGGQSSSLAQPAGTHAPELQRWGAWFDGGQSPSLAHGNWHAPATHFSATPPSSGQSAEARHGFGPQTVQRGAHGASVGQFVFDAHCGEQKPEPLASWTQCFSVSPVESGDWQSWSALHGAQYSRGRHQFRVCPKLRLSVATFGASLTRAHHQPPGHSLSDAQSKRVQKAVASAVPLA